MLPTNIDRQGQAGCKRTEEYSITSCTAGLAQGFSRGLFTLAFDSEDSYTPANLIPESPKEATVPIIGQRGQCSKETPRAQAGKPKNVELVNALVVDDDADNLLFAQYALESLSFQVTAVASGQQTVSAALACSPQVILLDLRMKDMCGLEVFSLLRECPQLDTVPIIAVTALAQSSWRDKAMSMGFSDYLVKPYMIADLGEMINRHLANPPLPKSAREQ
ncbi:MAG: response regulator [Cyanobacteria bacterium J06623_5]